MFGSVPKQLALVSAVFVVGSYAVLGTGGPPKPTSHPPGRPSHVSAAAQAAADDDTFTVRDNVNLVLLDVCVKGPKGGFVTGLGKTNFQVNEDGKAQTITQFASIDTPVSVGLVVDDSGSMKPKRPEVVLAGLAFAKESNREDEFFVVNFNNYVVNGLGDLPFTDDLQKLRSALYYGQPMGQTALYDAIAHALKHLELSKRDKRTLIVVSDGGDNVSKTSLAQVTEMIQSSRATIYTVGLFDPEDRDRNPDVLKRFAKMSGGEFFEPGQLNDVLAVFHKIAQDIRNRYTIGYVPGALAGPAKAVIHQVRVSALSADRRKLAVKTRTSYTTKSFDELVAQQDRMDSERVAKQ